MALVIMKGKKRAWAIGLGDRAGSMVVLAPGSTPVKDELWYGKEYTKEVTDPETKKVTKTKEKVDKDDPETWSGAGGHPDVQAALKSGLLRVLKDNKGKDVEPSTRKDTQPESLENFSDADAIALIEGTTFEGALERWSNKESRAEVVKAIEAQLDKVKKMVTAKK